MKRTHLYLVIPVILLLNISAHSFESFHSQKPQTDKVNYDSLYNSAVSVVNSDKGTKVINDCISTYGGKAHLEKLNTFQLSHNMLAYMMNEEMIVDRYFQKGRKYKIIKHKKPQIECRIIDGDDSWYLGRDTVIDLFSGKHKAELFSYLALSMPLALVNETYTDVRFGTRENDPLQYIYMKKNDTLMIVTGIDPQDNYIKKIEGVIYQDPNMFVFKNILSHHKKHDGYIFPDSLINFSMGLKVAQSKLIKVDINPEFTQSTFEPMKASQTK